MESEEKAEELAAGQQSRRTVPRFDVDEDAHLLLVKHGATLPCRIVDLSLSGCRVCTQERFPAGTMVQVEVNFSVRGLAFRFRGLTQWTDGRHQVGIRFVDLPERRKEELIEALSEVEEENAAKAARLAAEKLAAEEQAAALEAAEAALLAAVAAARRDQEEAPCRPPVLGPVETIAGRPVLPASRPTRLKLRSPSRTEVDTSVLIHLIHAGSWLITRTRPPDLAKLSRSANGALLSERASRPRMSTVPGAQAEPVFQGATSEPSLLRRLVVLPWGS